MIKLNLIIPFLNLKSSPPHFFPALMLFQKLVRYFTHGTIVFAAITLYVSIWKYNKVETHKVRMAKDKEEMEREPEIFDEMF